MQTQQEESPPRAHSTAAARASTSAAARSRSWALFWRAAAMDYRGQWLAEMLMMLLWLVFGGLSIIVAYVQQDQTPAWSMTVALTVVSTVLFVPDWRIWNRNPEKWLPAHV